MHLAREVHTLLQLAGLGLLVGRLAGEGSERGGLAERPQQVALGVERAAAGRACGRTGSRPSQHPAAAIGVQTRVDSVSRGAVPRPARPRPSRS